MAPDEHYTDYSDDIDTSSTTDRLDDIHSTLEEIRDALGNVKSNAGEWVWVFVFIFALASWEGSKLDRWTDRAWYSMYYSADWSNVNINKRPPDCDFLHAPLGSKGCHYKKQKLVFADDERRKLMQEATTPEERQQVAARPNTVIVYWEKKED
jgi:hypothetical protein